MTAVPRDSEHLASFEPLTARAVADVLQQAGLAAWTVQGDGEHEVRVAQGQRDEAFAALAASMEIVAERASGSGPSILVGRVRDEDAAGEDVEQPIMMERIRSWGLLIAAVLAPLLVITLASPPLPLGWSVSLYLAGLMGLLMWRAARG